MGNKIVHFELMGSDAEVLNAFYAELFDWKGEAVPGLDGYHLLSAETAGIGGAVGKGDEKMPSYVTVYVEVEDVDAHLAKAEAAGGTTVGPQAGHSWHGDVRPLQRPRRQHGRRRRIRDSSSRVARTGLPLVLTTKTRSRRA